MDSESCELGKRNWSDSYCSSLDHQAKRLCKNPILGSEEIEEDDFSCISDLIQVTHGDSEFSDGNLRFYDESTPNSTQADLDDLLMSLLRESETPNSSSVLPETIRSLDGDQGKMGGSLMSPYSGPTLTDIQSALSMYNRKEKSLSMTSSIFDSPTIFDSLQSAKQHPSQNWLDSVSHGYYRSFSTSINDMFYGRLRRAKSEAKYSVKVKCPGNSTNDGYKWRKYGQKSIKNSPYPRSYYRCTNPKCRAKKQVERCVDDPQTLTITYEGLHLHFSHPPLQISQQPNISLTRQDHNIYEKGKAVVPESGYNGLLNNEGGDLMQSSESPATVTTHQEKKYKCCEVSRFGRRLPAGIIADLLDGYNGHFNDEGGDLITQSSESYANTVSHQGGKDKCFESLRYRESMPVAQILGGTLERNHDIIGENSMDFEIVEEKSGRWCRDGLLQDIVPFEVINPSSSPASSSSSSP